MDGSEGVDEQGFDEELSCVCGGEGGGDGGVVGIEEVGGQMGKGSGLDEGPRVTRRVGFVVWWDSGLGEAVKARGVRG